MTTSSTFIPTVEIIGLVGALCQSEREVSDALKRSTVSGGDYVYFHDWVREEVARLIEQVRVQRNAEKEPIKR